MRQDPFIQTLQKRTAAFGVRNPDIVVRPPQEDYTTGDTLEASRSPQFRWFEESQTAEGFFAVFIVSACLFSIHLTTVSYVKNMRAALGTTLAK